MVGLRGQTLMEKKPDDRQNVVEGQDERVSLDEPSRFTLTRFRHSKYTHAFAWFLTLLGWWQ